MAQTQYRANLSAKDFVFVAEQWGRSVILKQYDQNFSRQVVSAADPDKDIGIPQIFYCHNVMPSGQGFQSIGYRNIIPPIQNGMTDIQYVNDLANNTYGYLGFEPVFPITGPGTVNIYGWTPYQDGAWVFIGNYPYVAQRPYVSTVNGQSYLYLTFTGCYKYNCLTHTLTPTTLTGLTATSIVGITNSFGYMIAWSTNAVFWSSTVDPTDFTPSLITGAGGGAVQEVIGNIAFCKKHVFGFVIYSDKNAVASVYSGNARYPFNFRAIVGSGGVVDAALCDTDPETGNHYVYSTSGLQLVSVTQATAVMPDVTNFLGGSRFEDFDEINNVFIERVIPQGTLSKKLTVVGNRYLILSYGIGIANTFTHALIYDIGMKRWGKVRINHAAVFEFFEAAALSDEQARQSIGFMKTGGDLFTAQLDMDWDPNNTLSITEPQGVMMLGKYQHTRARTITLDQVDAETTLSPSDCDCLVAVSYDGKNLQPFQSMYKAEADINSAWKTRVSGISFSLLFKGRFSLDSLMLSYHPNGRR